MRKNPLRGGNMPNATYLDEAAEIARELTHRESRGPGDMENAWRRLEAKYGIPYGVFWSLRYRKPKGLFWDVFNRLLAARNAERERQMRNLRHELEITKAIAGADSHSIRAAQALVDADYDAEE